MPYTAESRWIDASGCSITFPLYPIVYFNPLLVIIEYEIACVRVVVNKMWSIVAREVNFGMAVAFMISVEQRAI